MWTVYFQNFCPSQETQHPGYITWLSTQFSVWLTVGKSGKNNHLYFVQKACENIKNTSTSVIVMQQIHYSTCGNATTNVATKFLVELQQQLMANNITKGVIKQLPIHHQYVMRTSPLVLQPVMSAMQ